MILVMIVSALMGAGIVVQSYDSRIKTVREQLVEDFKTQVDSYGDLCAESSSGYDDMNGSDAHFEGVKCASESSLGSLWRLEELELR